MATSIPFFKLVGPNIQSGISSLRFYMGRGDLLMPLLSGNTLREMTDFGWPSMVSGSGI